VDVSGAASLAATLLREKELALLFRTLATLRTDLALFHDVEELRWTGPRGNFAELATRLDAAKVVKDNKNSS
jgi:hypothetical protein